MAKNIGVTMLDVDFELLTEREEYIFDGLLYPPSVECALGLLDAAEVVLERARIRLEKQEAKQQRRDQKLKGGK